MKILFLTNNNSAVELFNWLQSEGEEIELMQVRITEEFLNNNVYKLIISYGYRYIIKKEIIDKYRGKIINLHISYLPWNRGVDPNIWSFIENTPKGVTIHLIDEGIDTGEIIFQKKLEFNKNVETLRSSYEILQEEIQLLFKENWQKIKSFDFVSKKQIEKGSLHYKKDLEKIKSSIEDFNWDIPVSKLINIYRSSYTS